MSVDARGFATDPVRLRAAAGVTGGAARAVTDGAAALTAVLDGAGGASGGARLAEALGGFGQELRARAGLLADAVGATATALERTASDYEASDRTAAGALRPPDGPVGSMFGGGLG